MTTINKYNVLNYETRRYQLPTIIKYEDVFTEDDKEATYFLQHILCKADDDYIAKLEQSEERFNSFIVIDGTKIDALTSMYAYKRIRNFNVDDLGAILNSKNKEAIDNIWKLMWDVKISFALTKDTQLYSLNKQPKTDLSCLEINISYKSKIQPTKPLEIVLLCTSQKLLTFPNL